MPKIIKTVKIASILLACLAIFLLALPAVSGGSSQETVPVSKAETIFEKHKRLRGQAALAETDQVAPLIKEAKDFALYLNPPPPPTPPVSRNQTSRQNPSTRGVVSQEITEPQKTAARFDVLATCVNKVNPQASLALIYLNGNETKWVRQSAEIGHITVKEIHDGYVMLQDASRTFRKDMINQVQEMSLLTSQQNGQNQPKEISILESMQRNKPNTVTSMVNTPRRSATSTNTAAQRPIERTSAPRNAQTRRPAPQMSPEEQALVEKFFAEIDKLQTENVDSPAEIQKADEAINKMFQKMGDVQIDDNEVKDLDELGKRLDGAGAPLE